MELSLLFTERAKDSLDKNALNQEEVARHVRVRSAGLIPVYRIAQYLRNCLMCHV